MARRGISEERLREIEARANAATPAPWFTSDRLEGVWKTVALSHRRLLRSSVAIPMNRFYIRDDCASLTEWDGWVNEAVHREHRNAEFIVHARRDVPDLIEEVRRLRALLEEGPTHEQ